MHKKKNVLGLVAKYFHGTYGDTAGFAVQTQVQQTLKLTIFAISFLEIPHLKPGFELYLASNSHQ